MDRRSSSWTSDEEGEDKDEQSSFEEHEEENSTWAPPSGLMGLLRTDSVDASGFVGRSSRNENSVESGSIGSDVQGTLSVILSSDGGDEHGDSPRSSQQFLPLASSTPLRHSGSKRSTDSSSQSSAMDLESPSPVKQLKLGNTLSDKTHFAEVFFSHRTQVPMEELISENCTEPTCYEMPKVFPQFGPGDISFLLDTKSIPEADMLIDNCGMWTSTTSQSSTTHFFYGTDLVPRKTKEGAHFVLTKRYRSHGNVDPPGSLLKCLWICKVDGLPVGKALLSYRVKESCSVIDVPHGNAKYDNTAYRRSFHSTLTTIEDMRKTTKPQLISSQLVKNFGGLSANIDDQRIPRNVTQVYNRCRQIAQQPRFGCGRPHSEIGDLFSLMRNADSFVKAVYATPGSERVFLASKSMLESFRASCVRGKAEIEGVLQFIEPGPGLAGRDMQDHFLSTEMNDASMSCGTEVVIDMTFDICDLYVTNAVFRSAAVMEKKKFGHKVLLLGAIMLSRTKAAADYKWFADSLKNALGAGDDDRLRCFVTDSEAALTSMRSCTLFKEPSYHILCERHLRKNTEALLKKKGAAVEDIKTVLTSIYGEEEASETGRIRRQGAVDALSEDHFREVVEGLRTEFEVVAPGFCNAFLSSQGARIISSYLLPHRFASGLGSGRRTTNSVEAMNKVMQDTLRNVRGGALRDVVMQLENFVRAKYVDVGRALFGSGGGLRLTDDYSDLGCSAEEWRLKGAEERRNLLHKIGVYEGEVDEARSAASLRELYPFASSILSAEGFDDLVQQAEALHSSGNVRDLQPGYAINIGPGRALPRVDVDSGGLLKCSSCSSRASLCAHNLAVALHLNELDDFLGQVNERQKVVRAAQIRNEARDPHQGRKTRRDGHPSTAKPQNRSITSHILIAPPASPSSVALPTAAQIAFLLEPANPQFTQPYHNDEKFELVFIHSLVVDNGPSTSRARSSATPVCITCGISFSTLSRAPEDVCFQHEERYKYPTGSGRTRQYVYSDSWKRPQYVHARFDCVLSRYPYFKTAEHLTVAPAVSSRLLPVHFAHLADQFGYQQS